MSIADPTLRDRIAEALGAAETRCISACTPECRRAHQIDALLPLIEQERDQWRRVAAEQTRMERDRAERAEATLREIRALAGGQRGAERALREAAESIPAQVAMATETRRRIRVWLRDRADRIGEGGGEG